MEVIIFESNAYKQLIEKIEALSNVISTIEPKQQENDDDKWVDSVEVCDFLRISERTLQRLRTSGNIAYSNIGGKYYYQISQIKKMLSERLIKSSEEQLNELIEHHRQVEIKRKLRR